LIAMNDLILQQPTTPGAASAELFLLFHGVGATADSLRGLGQHLAQDHPDAWVVSVQAPSPSDLSPGGWQWFSVRGVTSENRAARADAAMPAFVAAVSQWQAHTGMEVARTTLLGFSQGAIMALAATQLPQAPAARVVALSGRLPGPARQAPAGLRIHLIHGQQDQVVPTEGSVEAHAQLQALGAQVSLDLIPGLGHGVDARVLERLRARLAD
jgi:phospholipase/carboxylesterase